MNSRKPKLIKNKNKNDYIISTSQYVCPYNKKDNCIS